MNDAELLELKEVREFVNASTTIRFRPANQAESYKWVAGTLKRFNYFKLTKKDKGTARAYLARRTGYSRAQLNRLIAQYRKKRWIGERRRARNCFAKYSGLEKLDQKN